MPQLVDRLTELAADGQPITFPAIGLTPETVANEASDVAAGPFAPYLVLPGVENADGGGVHGADVE